MWWHDIREMKEKLNKIESYINEIEQFDNNDIQDSFDIIHDKINKILNDSNRLEQVALAEKTLDKFEDYMKNADKLNSMINEFKGCISMARASLAEKKEFDEQKTILKNMIETFQKYYDYQSQITNQHYKIDAIYKALVDEKTPVKKKRKSTPRKKSNPSPLS